MMVANPPNDLWRMLRLKPWKERFFDPSRVYQYNDDQAKVKLVFQGYSLFPLHFALVEGAPTEIIEALLQSCPNAAKHHYHHDLPVHIAIKQKRGLNIIQFLMSAYPQVVHKTCNGEDLMTLVRNIYGRQDPVTKYFDGEIAKLGSASLNPINLRVTDHPTMNNLNTPHRIVEQLRNMQIAQEQMMSTLSALHDKQSLLSETSTRLEEVVSNILQTLPTIKTSVATASEASEARAPSATKEDFFNLSRSIQTEFQAIQTLVKRLAEVKEAPLSANIEDQATQVELSAASEARAPSATKEDFLNLSRNIQTEFQVVQTLVERFEEVKEALLSANTEDQATQVESLAFYDNAFLSDDSDSFVDISTAF